MRPYGWTNKLTSANKVHRDRSSRRRQEIGYKTGGHLWRQIGTTNGALLATGDILINYSTYGLAAIQDWATKHSEAGFWVEDEFILAPPGGAHLRGARGTTAATHADGIPVMLEGLK